MTSLHTLPVPHPTSTAHEHAWLIESRHTTSEGVLLYVRCGDCGTRRVDLQTFSAMPPAPLSVELHAR
ncbi:hypothetical protein [Microbacterium sp. CR_7]|uniref:hypothetical protein n=1 Tax=Microbacterium sp. CR_7 TaxID=3055792 RepID=UPI0035C014C2